MNFKFFQNQKNKKKQRKKKITFEDIQEHFETPIKEAAANLQVSLTQLKRICREEGIPRWPHRKVFGFFSVFLISTVDEYSTQN